MLLDMSATSGTAPVSGVKWYSTPPIGLVGADVHVGGLGIELPARARRHRG
jgi:hypothetical protein